MKKVLVIEEPKNCLECPCIGTSGGIGTRSGEWCCEAAGKIYTRSQVIMLKTYEPFRPGFCPLRDLPDYKLDWRAGDGGYESGWNDCLDKIGGCRR